MADAYPTAAGSEGRLTDHGAVPSKSGGGLTMQRGFYGGLAIIFIGGFLGCSNIGALVKGEGPEPLDAKQLSPMSAAAFENALKDNQAALAEGRRARDVALFNIGIILAHPMNPRKDHSRALLSFKELVNEHPRSALVEQAKTWIHVLEERQELARERQKLAEERRALARERELLAQERQKMDYVNQKSLQLDLEIEKRRRSLRK